jgi:hypothetical protein
LVLFLPLISNHTGEFVNLLLFITRPRNRVAARPGFYYLAMAVTAVSAASVARQTGSVFLVGRKAV